MRRPHAALIRYYVLSLSCAGMRRNQNLRFFDEKVSYVCRLLVFLNFFRLSFFSVPVVCAHPYFICEVIFNGSYTIMAKPVKTTLKLRYPIALSSFAHD